MEKKKKRKLHPLMTESIYDMLQPTESTLRSVYIDKCISVLDYKHLDIIAEVYFQIFKELSHIGEGCGICTYQAINRIATLYYYEK